MLCGGAPLSGDTQRFVNICMGYVLNTLHMRKPYQNSTFWPEYFICLLLYLEIWPPDKILITHDLWILMLTKIQPLT